MKSDIQKLFVLPTEIQEAVLKYYIQKCREIGHVQFFEWRLKFPNDHTNLYELEELLEGRYSQIRK